MKTESRQIPQKLAARLKFGDILKNALLACDTPEYHKWHPSQQAPGWEPLATVV